MFAYCRNNPVSRIDTSGDFDKESFDMDGDPTSDEGDDRGMRASTGSEQLPLPRWEVFKTAMKDAAKGLNMAMGERTGRQNHHLFSDKNSTYTPQYKEVTDEYDLDLSGRWNTRTLDHHSGRHTEKYHKFSLEMLFMIDEIAQGDKDLFIEGVDIFGDFIQENYWIPYAR